MTQHSDQLRQGAAYFAPQGRWNSPTALNGLPVATSPQDTSVLGAMHTQTFCYQVGTASTALATGIFFSASGTATTGTTTLTATGALVSGGVATLDVPRAIRITASVNLSTTTFTIIGTDGYGQLMQWAGVGPSGDTLGNTGSYVDTSVAFKTASSITISAAATGIATTALEIGTSNTFGMPYVVANAGMGLDCYINGNSATVPGTWTAAYTPTGTPTATTTDVRGLYAVSTLVLPNGSRYFTFQFITPNVNLTPNTDTTVNTFGATPFHA